MFNLMRIRPVLHAFVAVAILLTPALALAQATSTISSESPSLYRGVRPLGMGNAFLAMPGTDENAPYYNPASANDFEKKLHMQILSPSFYISSSVISLTKDMTDLAKDINAKASTDNGGKIDVFRTFVDKHVGEFQSLGVALPIFQVRHKWFHLSTLADSRNTFSFRNRAFNTNVELLSRSDAGALLGTSHSFLDDQLQVGLATKVIYRLSIDRIITIDDVINNPKFGDIIPLNRSIGVGFDLGLKGKIPTMGTKILEYINPVAGLTWQDVGNTRFGGAVPNTDQSISVGFALQHDYSGWMVSLANDMRELNQTEQDIMKKWNIGAEVTTPKLWRFLRVSARVGGHQGYLAAGGTLDFRFLKLEFATFAEEVGKFTSQRGDRRLAANITFGF